MTTAPEPAGPADTEQPATPFTLLGDADGAVCVDGICAVPGAGDMPPS